LILIDYNQVLLAVLLSQQKELRQQDSKGVHDMTRHIVLSCLKSYKKQFSKQYGQMVICCDGSNYWRREQFPHYKASRKKAREESDLDWTSIFSAMDELRTDLKNHFPYKVLHVDGCEADDVIASLVIWAQDHELQDGALFASPQEMLIVSSDGDFQQLQMYQGVKQWSPRDKKYITCKDPKSYLIEHIVRGDSGDGVPNVLSKDDSFVSGTRQTPVRTKLVEAFLNRGKDACETDEILRNWDRNKLMIDLHAIPTYIQNKIVNEYLTVKPGGDKMAVFNYLVKNRCRMLLNDVDEF